MNRALQPYWQILKSYGKNKIFLFVSITLVIYCFMIEWIVKRIPSDANLLNIIVIVSAAWPVFFGEILKKQFAHPRSIITPKFRVINLRIATAIYLLYVFFSFKAFSATLPYAQLGTYTELQKLATFILWESLGLWLGYLFSGGAYFIVLGFFYWALKVMFLLLCNYFGRAEFVALNTVLGLLLLIILGKRLWNLREESWEYDLGQKISAYLDSAMKSTAPELTDTVKEIKQSSSSKKKSDVIGNWLEKAIKTETESYQPQKIESYPANGALFDRVQYWRTRRTDYGFDQKQAIGMGVICLIGGVTLFFITGGIFNDLDLSSINLNAIFLLIFFTVFLFFFYEKENFFLESILLKPVRRRRLIFELKITETISFFTSVLMMVLFLAPSVLIPNFYSWLTPAFWANITIYLSGVFFGFVFTGVFLKPSRVAWILTSVCLIFITNVIPYRQIVPIESVFWLVPTLLIGGVLLWRYGYELACNAEMGER